jgi:Family of unknown function (DUF6314)
VSAVSDLLICLRRCRELRFIAYRDDHPKTWTCNGVGAVAIESPSAQIVIFNESGTSRLTSGRELRFTNAYRWSLVSRSVVRLEHLRFGPNRPVYLFDLAPQDESTWASVTPHHCRSDLYSLQFELGRDAVSLLWMIVGPGKREKIQCVYSFKVPDSPSQQFYSKLST